MTRYGITAFVSGAAVMVGEIAAARAIAPHFGTSIVVWTSVIGIILVALAFGYWIGGRLSERRADDRVLGTILLAAGLLLTVPAFAMRAVAGALTLDLLRLGSGFLVILVGSLLIVVLLFALPIACLGMVSPLLVKLAMTDRSDVGAIAGRLSAIATIGSLVGTFLPTLLTLPTIGTRRTILLAAMVLVILGVSFLPRRRIAVATVGIVALLTIPEPPIPWMFGGTVIAQRESRYQYLRVVEVSAEQSRRDASERLLLSNEGFGVQSKAVLGDAIPTGYASVAAAMPALVAPSTRARILILGNAGGTVAHLIERFFPHAPLDIIGVELDPAVTAIIAATFPPPPQPYPIHHADARVFVRGTTARYDVIIADAYTNQLTIPPHLASREFFALLRERLASGGVLVVNVNAPRRDSALLQTIAQTIAAEFPHVVLGKAGETWNELLLASDAPLRPRLSRLETLALPAVAREEIDGFLRTVEDISRHPNTRVFTDDWAPIELMTDVEIFDTLRTLAR